MPDKDIPSVRPLPPRKYIYLLTIWGIAFLAASVYLVGTNGLTRSFEIAWLRVYGFVVEPLSAAESRPWDAIGAARIIKLGRDGYGQCYSIALSRDDKYLIAAMGYPPEVELLSFPAGRMLQRYRMRWASSVAFSSRDERIAIAARRNMVVSLTDGRFGATAPTAALHGIALGFFAGGNRLALLTRGSLAVFAVGASPDSGVRLAVPADRGGVLREIASRGIAGEDILAVPEAGRRLFMASDLNNDVACVARPSLHRLWRVDIPGEITAISASPDGRSVFCVGDRRSWDNESWVFDPVGGALAASEQGRIWILSGMDGSPLRTVKSSSVFAGVDYDPRGEYVAVVRSWDCRLGGSSLVLTNWRTGARRRALSLQYTGVLDGPVRFSMDGRYVLAACHRGRFAHGGCGVVIWRVRR